ncbi:MAG: large conductance mechanosensitive channel protein MscL [Patescibacteria group bacterium]
MLKEFKKFILRGNVVDLAVGVVIGAAFTTVVNSVVKDMITPVITVFGSTKRFADAHFTVRGSEFLYGDLINSIITFLIVAAVIFFIVVQPINKLTERFGMGKDTEAPTHKCPHCLSKIPKEATKCMFCTSEIKKAA